MFTYADVYMLYAFNTCADDTNRNNQLHEYLENIGDGTLLKCEKNCTLNRYLDMQTAGYYIDSMNYVISKKILTT